MIDRKKLKEHRVLSSTRGYERRRQISNLSPILKPAPALPTLDEQSQPALK